jgi:hypothetical protein
MEGQSIPGMFHRSQNGRRQVNLVLVVSLVAISSAYAGVVVARQSVDTNYNAHVSRPAFIKRHPRVLFDEAHNNAATTQGTYKPFADLIASDGYQVVANTRGFTNSVLSGYDIVVIVNAAGPGTQREGPAFTDAETDSLFQWVRAGGALLLITDHLPFSASISSLAKRFNVEITKGYTVDPINFDKESGDQTEILFSRENGLLGEDPITRGRDDTEHISRIITFSGTSIKGPADSDVFLKLADTAMDVLPPAPKEVKPDEALPEHVQVSASGRAQGLALRTGKGRVVVLGEAAMLTAQLASRGFPFGMNVTGIDNRQLALNIMHWLSGLLR